MELNRDTHIEIWSFYTILFAFEGKIHIQKRKLTWLKFNQNWSQLEYSAIERRKNCHIMFCQSHKFIRLVYVWNHFISWIKKLEYRIFEGKIPFRHQIILKAVGCPKRKNTRGCSPLRAKRVITPQGDTSIDVSLLFSPLTCMINNLFFPQLTFSVLYRFYRMLVTTIMTENIAHAVYFLLMVNSKFIWMAQPDICTTCSNCPPCV